MANSKKKIISVSIIFGLAFLVLLVLAVFPLLKGIKKTSEDFVEIKRTLVLSQDKSGNADQIRKIYQEIEPDFKKTEGFLVDSGAPVDLIKFWETTAEASQISISISSLAPKKSEIDPWNVMGFQLSLSGSFPGFMKFLEKIEAGPYLVEAQNLSIKGLAGSADTGPSSGDVDANLIIKVFTK